MANSKVCQTPSFKVKPKNTPSIINTHLTEINGKWIEAPGALAVIIGVNKEENECSTIEKVIKPLLENSKIKENSELQAKIYDCKHKMYAVKYHLDEIKKEIHAQYKEYATNYYAGSGASFEHLNPALIFETESFLFQVKSNLDLITQFLGYTIPSLKNFRTFAHSGEAGEKTYSVGGKIINALKKTSDKELVDLFSTNAELWIQEMTQWRDTITHYSKLKNFSCFIQTLYKGGEEVTINYPTMPNGEKLDEYCEKIFTYLMNLYEAIFSITKKRFERKIP